MEKHTLVQISRLARLLRKIHRCTKSWRDTSVECKVLTDDGRENPGLAKRIAIDGYIPSADVIDRLIRHGAIEQKIKRARTTHAQDLFDMPTPVLLWKLINREVLQ